MTPEVPWIAWVIVAPLLGATLTLLFGRGARLIAAASALATALAAGALVLEVAAGQAVRHSAGGWAAPLGIQLRVDGLAALALATVCAVGGLVTAHAVSEPPAGATPGSRRQFFALWLFGWAALNAVTLSADLFNLYVTLELTALAAVALIALADDRAAWSAALRYLFFALAGSLAYLFGVVLLYSAYSTLDLELLGARASPDPILWVALAAMTLGLCLKTGLFPLHVWIPPAYASAQTHTSALLSGLIGKAPLYVLLRLWLEVYPPALRPAPGLLLGVLGSFGVLWGSLLALRQQRLKTLLAYSSIAQIGYLFLPFPLGTREAWTGGVVLFASHAAAKSSMFLAAGTIETAAGSDRLSAVRGIARHLPFTFFALGLSGLTLIGVPPAGGFVAKFLLVRASIEQGQWWWAVVLLAGGLLAAGYVFRIVRPAFWPERADLRPVPRRTQILTLMLALLSVALGIAAHPPLVLLEAGGLP
jgi:multicomponent Na+:H+ antiporter subunit D